MSVMEEKFKALGRLGYTGDLPNRELQWLQAGGATSNVVLEARAQFLAANGQNTGIVQHDWYNYLGAQGATGTLNERELKFWEGLGP